MYICMKVDVYDEKYESERVNEEELNFADDVWCGMWFFDDDFSHILNI